MTNLSAEFTEIYDLDFRKEEIFNLKDMLSINTLSEYRNSNYIKKPCEHCEKIRLNSDDLVHKRQISLSHVSDCLIVTIERFTVSSKYQVKKVKNLVNIPLELDFDEYLTNDLEKEDLHYELIGAVV
jgi:hypothetical protein